VRARRPAPARRRRAQPAGALIARIDESAPILVGDRQVLTANRTGRLYLGVNDDHLADNGGELRVVLTRR